jgi:hypothetical protein
VERVEREKNKFKVKPALADSVFRPSARARAALLETPPPAPRQEPPPQLKKKRFPAYHHCLNLPCHPPNIPSVPFAFRERDVPWLHAPLSPNAVAGRVYFQRAVFTYGR